MYSTVTTVYCESTHDVWCCSFASSVHGSCNAVSCLGICTGPRPGTCVDRACYCTVAPQWSAVQWVRLLKNPRAQPNQPWNSGDANGHEGRFGGCCLDQRGHASAGLRWSGGSEGRKDGKGGVRRPISAATPQRQVVIGPRAVLSTARDACCPSSATVPVYSAVYTRQ